MAALRAGLSTLSVLRLVHATDETRQGRGGGEGGGQLVPAFSFEVRRLKMPYSRVNLKAQRHVIVHMFRADEVYLGFAIRKAEVFPLLQTLFKAWIRGATRVAIFTHEVSDPLPTPVSPPKASDDLFERIDH